MFKTFRYEYVNLKEFNKKLNFAKNCRIIRLRAKAQNESISYFAYLEDKKVEMHLTMKDEFGKNCTYIFCKDGKEKITGCSPLTTWQTINKYYKVPKLYQGKEKAPFSSSGIRYYNPKYNKTRIDNCYGYDINSSYSYGLKYAKIPDTSQRLDVGFVKKGEIGFDLDGKVLGEGYWAMWRFKAFETSPFAKFIDTWYAKKRNAKTPKDKKKAKDMMNLAIGNMQKHGNCFIRAAVLDFCNKRIQELIDKYPDDILFSNTDSVVSKRELPELELGNDLGQWKVEHQGKFAYKCYTYQWNNDKPSYQGVPKNWFKENYDILVDPLPINGNIYKLDKDILQIVLKEDKDEKDICTKAKDKKAK